MTDQQGPGPQARRGRLRTRLPWLPAGLIGAIVLVVLTALNLAAYLLPAGSRLLLATCVCAPLLPAYLGTGLLAAHWSGPPRSLRRGALIGALAGLVAGGVDAVFSAFAYLLLAFGGVYGHSLSRMPAEQLDLGRQSGFGFMYTSRGLLAYDLCSTPVCLVFAIACAALGGLIYAAWSPGAGQAAAAGEAEGGSAPASYPLP